MQHAIAYTGSSQEVYGAKATINVWEPSIQVVNEFSLSQIWILSGSFDGSDLNSIEAGWQVYILSKFNVEKLSLITKQCIYIYIYISYMVFGGLLRNVGL